MIKELENSNEILAIERTITGYKGTLLLAHRRFIKKGMLQKSSRKTQTPRMFFLFSDILLHTEPTGPSTYKFKNEMKLCSVRVEVPKVSLVPFSFELLGTNRAFILSARSEEEMVEWMTTLAGAIRNEEEKMKSLKRGEQLSTLDRSGFGSFAPILVPDQSVSMCQICSEEFTFIFRRHHCRACGRVVCGNCSPFKAYLAYMNKEERICSVCNHHQIRQHSSQGRGDEIDGDVQSPAELSRPIIPSVLILDHEKEAITRGYVLEQDGKKWNRCWYVVGKDLALYKFKAHEDIKANGTVPLPGYRVTSDKASMTINLIHHQAMKELNLSFKTENLADFETWVEVVEKAAQMEVCEVPVNQDNRMSVSYGSKNRVCSKSVQDIVDSEEPVPAPLTPQSTRRTSFKAFVPEANASILVSCVFVNFVVQ
uniref:FYVE, RhoGEF and PH domain-containing protein 6 n=1 Tax=Amphimedon queenslandica TaxID=400682 RepID=A0A1X7T846_AMPQE